MNPELTTASSLYETDFALWTEQTVEFLRERNFKEVDWENVIEEIESLGRSEKTCFREPTNASDDAHTQVGLSTRSQK